MKNKMIDYFKRNIFVFTVLSLGLSFLLAGYYVMANDIAMIYDYNQGLANFQNGNIGYAKVYFKRVISDYNANYVNGNFISRSLLPSNSRELAALSYFQLGNAYFTDMNLNRAVKAYEASLEINPGNDYSLWQAFSYSRLHREAMNTKYNLEILFIQNPQMQKKQGQKQSTSNSQGKQGNPPNHMPGHGMHHGQEPPQNSSGI